MFKLIILICFGISLAASDTRPPLANTFRTREKIIYDQYPYEGYWVTTLDGYILNLHRIANSAGIPILLVHGLSSQSSSWIMHPSQIKPGDSYEKNLGYLLYTAGFDVWIPDMRGNSYSTNHTYLDPASGQILLSGFYEYWDFSYEELATKDLPALIDFILAKTGKSQLSYVGMSLGTTDFITLQAMNPTYALSKINFAVLLAPVAYLGNITSLFFKALATLVIPGFTELLIRDLGPGQFTPQSSVQSGKIVADVCSLAALDTPINYCLITPAICETYMFLLYGWETDQLDCNNIPLYMVQTDKSSTKTMLHLAEGINGNGFTRYDYGFILNYFKYYGRLAPPKYNLKNVKVPMAMYWGETDALADPTDVKRLYDEIRWNYADQNDIQLIKVNHTQWNHADFIWAKDVVTLLYNNVISQLKFRNGI